MSARSAALRAGIVAALAPALLGCASSGAPRGFLRRPETASVDAWGGWARVWTRVRTDSVEPGELIAASNDTLFILGLRRGLQAVATSRLRRAQVFGWRSSAGSTAGWVTGGVLSTASHGVGLIISAPAWSIIGGIIAHGASVEPRLLAPPEAFGSLRLYARFPQGLPPDLDRSELRWPPREVSRQ